MNFLKKISIRYWLPNRCRRCLSKTHTRIAVCAPCIDELPWLTGSVCLSCAAPLKSESSSITQCGSCLQQPSAIDRSWCAFHFEPPIQDYVHGLKFSHHWETAHLISTLMADRLLKTDVILPEAILAVPLHHSRLRQRGYNQASLIGAHLAKKLNLGFHADFLKRHKNTNAQAQLKYKDRGNNLANAFSLIKPIPYKHIALIDDVYTTGSTLKSLANMIRSQSENSIRIDAICVARAQRKVTK